MQTIFNYVVNSDYIGNIGNYNREIPKYFSSFGGTVLKFEINDTVFLAFYFILPYFKSP